MRNSPIHVFLAGDSTVADYGCRTQPMMGWGQVLPTYFDRQQVLVRNYAICGRSSRTFVEEGRLARIAREIQPGDCLFIQFGHNDATVAKPERYVEPTHDFGAYLRQYIAVAREHEATPVLVTPMQRRNFDANGRLVYDHGPYIAAMQEAAAAEQVTLLDLSAVSGACFAQAGVQGTKRWFFQYPARVLPNYPEGREDNTNGVFAKIPPLHAVARGRLDHGQLRRQRGAHVRLGPAAGPVFRPSACGHQQSGHLWAQRPELYRGGSADLAGRAYAPR